MLECSNFGVSLEVRTQNLICLKKLNCCILNKSFTPSVYRLSHTHYNCKLLICFWVPSNKILIHMMDVSICHCVWCVLLNGGIACWICALKSPCSVDLEGERSHRRAGTEATKKMGWRREAELVSARVEQQEQNWAALHFVDTLSYPHCDPMSM